MTDIIICGSSKLCAETLSEKAGVTAIADSGAPDISHMSTVVYIGGLYAGCPREVRSMYKTVTIKYTPKVKDMAQRIEDAANEMERSGLELVSCTVMPSAKAILVFKTAAADSVSDTEAAEQI